MRVGTLCNTPLGPILIEENGRELTGLSFTASPPPDVSLRDTPLLRKAAEQLAEYFAGARQRFALPFSLVGTNFQRKVWRALCDIPYGETRAYADIAAGVGSPQACRAVGLANSRNPLPIIVPCHRVIGKDGSLTGFAGGLDIKQHLLELEREHICGVREQA